MAITTDDLIAIVGGSLAGLVVFLVILAVLIYCACGKKRRESEKHRRLPHNISQDSSISKRSKLGNGVDPRLDSVSDPRLPKVSSNGLWMGTPSMYAHGPSQAYYGDKPRRQPTMERAISDDRIASPHMVYQGNVQLYHSQQVQPTYEPYGGHLPRSNSYMDLYSPSPYAGYPSSGFRDIRDSRAVLVEYPDDSDPYYDPYRDVFEDRKRGNKVQRTHSDLTGTKRKRRQRKQETPYDLHVDRRNQSKERREDNDRRNPNRERREDSDRRRLGKDKLGEGSDRIYHSKDRRDNSYQRKKGSVDSRERAASVEVHERRSRERELSTSKRSQQSMESRQEDIKSANVNEQELSQTDSAKLRAIKEKNKDIVDGKPFSEKWNNADELRLNLPKDSDEDDVEVKRYEYKGDFKNQNSRTIENAENDKNRINDSTFVSVTVKPEVYERSGYDNPVFHEEDEVHMRPANKPRAERAESNADGKQVSAAFDFLNNYLSDDEGTEYMESRTQSPVPL